MSTHPTASDVTPAVERAADHLFDQAPILNDEDAQDLARVALAAALDLDELTAEAAAALFGAPNDPDTPHMPQRENETYLDWTWRVAHLAAAAIRDTILGTHNTRNPPKGERLMSQPATGTPCPACGNPRGEGETWILHAKVRDRAVLVHPGCTTKPLKNK